MQQSTGQTAAQASSSWNPTHSVQSLGSMTKMSSPWLMAWLGHSGSQAPQLMHSSVMMVAMLGVCITQEPGSDGAKPVHVHVPVTVPEAFQQSFGYGDGYGYVDGFQPSQTVFTLTNSRMPSRDNSRPNPLALMPPNGSRGSLLTIPLMKTDPASSSSASRAASDSSRVNAAAPRPNSVSLASAMACSRSRARAT